MSLGREYQILNPNVLKPSSPNVVVFALLTINSFLLLAECEPFLKKLLTKSGYKDYKVLEISIANLRKQLTSMVDHSAFNGKLL